VEGKDEVEIRSRAELRAWLSENHTRTESIVLIHHKKVSPHYVSWGDIVLEALCFGWIDGRAKSVDALRTSHLLCPRREGSHWSAINKRNIERLESEGLMEDAGRAVIERAKADGSWQWLDDVENLVIPADLEDGLADPAARAGWDAFPASEKKIVLFNLKSAKRPATRAKRLALALANATAGKRTYT
jgi:uncharacterized protein YdeI (YjbR/CyaY-like superfamily)